MGICCSKPEKNREKLIENAMKGVGQLHKAENASKSKQSTAQSSQIDSGPSPSAGLVGMGVKIPDLSDIEIHDINDLAHDRW